MQIPKHNPVKTALESIFNDEYSVLMEVDCLDPGVEIPEQLIDQAGHTAMVEFHDDDRYDFQKLGILLMSRKFKIKVFIPWESVMSVEAIDGPKYKASLFHLGKQIFHPSERPSRAIRRGLS